MILDLARTFIEFPVNIIVGRFNNDLQVQILKNKNYTTREVIFLISIIVSDTGILILIGSLSIFKYKFEFLPKYQKVILIFPLSVNC